LKILNTDMDGLDEVAQRMRDEARLLGLLRHRSIVQVDGLVMLNGKWAIVMEYIEGVDLHQIIQHIQVPLGPAMEIVSEVATALHIAYSQERPQGGPLRLMHRDIKPANIQLTAAGEVKLLDFGIARAEFDTREAKTQEVLFGSIGYMAPERLDFDDAATSDVYSVGVVLFEMLTRSSLGKNSANPDRHLLIIKQAALQLRRSGFDEEIVQLFSTCVAYDPEDRPTPRDLSRWAQEIRRHCADPSLMEWAESIVPDLRENFEREEDELSGTVLREDTDSDDDEPPQAPRGLPPRHVTQFIDREGLEWSPQGHNLVLGRESFPGEQAAPTEDTITEEPASASPAQRWRGPFSWVTAVIGMLALAGMALCASAAIAAFVMIHKETGRSAPAGEIPAPLGPLRHLEPSVIEVDTSTPPTPSPAEPPISLPRSERAPRTKQVEPRSAASDIPRSAAKTERLERAGPGGPAETQTKDEAGSSDRLTRSITISSRPLGAKVYLDGVDIGHTPRRGVAVSEGLHLLRVAHDGVEQWFEREIRISPSSPAWYSVNAQGQWEAKLK